MEPELAAKFPEIKTYLGRGIDDTAMSMRCDWSPRGFHALVISGESTIVIHPSSTDDITNYMSYYSRDYKEAAGEAKCLVQGKHRVSQSAFAPSAASGDALRTYRIAIATTKEYSNDPNLGGGTVASALASVTTWLNGVNTIFDREVSIRMTLVANNDKVILTTEDILTNASQDQLLRQVRSVLRDRIGQDNYDVGHVLATGGGGVAFVGVICSNRSQENPPLGPLKGGGVTQVSAPVGNIRDLKVLAHELGHQFGSDHPFNDGGMGSQCASQRSDNGTFAYEPGSGSTLMCYAGICGQNNVARESELRFHVASINAILAHINDPNAGGSCGTRTTRTPANSIPTVTGTTPLSIPRNTPFTLTATGNDADPGDVPNLTYCWEQFDAGGQNFFSPPFTDAADSADTTRPIFRSFPPTASPSRTFPSLTYILNNGGVPPPIVNDLQTAESLPNITRTVNFRCTIRDQRGGVNDTAVVLNVTAGAGPFRVTTPAANAQLTPGTLTNVIWDVANTSAAPINTANVKITLSTDGGTTFSSVSREDGTGFADNMPNSGTAVVRLPNATVGDARIKVEAIGNVFFNISPRFFIRGACGAIAFTPNTIPDAMSGLAYNQTISVTGGTAPIAFSITAGALPQMLSLSRTGQITGTAQDEMSTYNFTVTATDAAGCSSNKAYALNLVPQMMVGDAGAGGGAGGGQALNRAAATTTAVFSVSLSDPSKQPVTVKFATKDGTAIAGKNYQAASGTLTFPPGVTTQTITVTVMGVSAGDDEDEFFVDLSEAVGAIIEDGEGEGDIVENDPANCPSIALSPTTLAAGRAGFSYNQTLTASGGAQIRKFDLDGGTLPPGITLNHATGTLTGTPMAAGIFTFSIAAIDANHCFGAQTYALTIGSAAPAISDFNPTSARAGTSVTIKGINLTGATAVRFNGKPATSITVNSPNQITATVPPSPSSGAITVTTPNGTATSAVNFGGLNTAPVATDRTLTTGKNTPLFGKLSASDADGDALIFSTYPAEHGSHGGTFVLIDAAGDFTYTPGATFSGVDVILFTAFDGKQESNLATMTVTVTQIAQPAITGAQLSGKNLQVSGANFDAGAVILLNGVDQRTKNDGQTPAGLIGKKLGNQITPGQSVTLQVRNSDGKLSAAFSFVRPSG